MEHMRQQVLEHNMRKGQDFKCVFPSCKLKCSVGLFIVLPQTGLADFSLIDKTHDMSQPFKHT